MIRNLMIAALVTVVAGIAPRTQAQAPPLDCRAVQAIGEAMRDEILAELNATVADTSIEISRRKEFHIIEVEDIRFEGCRLRAKVAVELERKVRRDADGYAYVVGTVESMTLRPTRRLCLDRKPHVDRLDLAHTLKIGERIYTRVANRVYPPGRCFPA